MSGIAGPTGQVAAAAGVPVEDEALDGEAVEVEVSLAAVLVSEPFDDAPVREADFDERESVA